MRHEYILSDESRKVMTNHVGYIADEMDVSPQHLYAMLAGTYTDPFAPFAHLYAAAIRAGCDVTPWDARLSSIRGRYRKSPRMTPAECLAAKLTRDTDATLAVMKALEDGQIDDHEWQRIAEALERQEQTINQLRSLRPGSNVREIGRRAVADRRATK